MAKVTLLEGPKLTQTIDDNNNKGLGHLYCEKMKQNKDKIHQIDVHSGLTETNGSVIQRALQVATKMKANGVSSDDIIVICSKSHADQTVAVLSVLLIGAIIAPMDPDLNHNDSFSLMQKLKPKMIFCDLRAVGQIERVLSELGRHHLCTIALFNTEHTDRLAFEKYLIDKPDPNFQVFIVKNIRDKIAFILPTQGATGPVKLVCISHRAILHQTLICSKLMQNVERILSYFPLSWITQTILMCTSFETKLTRILPGNFSERNACKIIRDLKVDHAILGTEYAIKIAHDVSLQDYDLSCLQCVMVGGYSTTALDISHLKNHLNDANFIHVYGTSETGCVSGFLEKNSKETLEHPASVGKLLPGTLVKVVSIETRELLGPDKWGELLVKSDGMMSGYFRDTGLTNASMEKGFFKTGDMAQYDSAGFLYIKCRICDLINIRGMFISPLEIEDVILAHPRVLEVIVISDGKEIVACVVKKPDDIIYSDELQTYIADRLPDFKCPNRIKFYDKFPKTPIGKVKKNEIRNNIFHITIRHSKSLGSVLNTNQSLFK